MNNIIEKLLEKKTEITVDIDKTQLNEVMKISNQKEYEIAAILNYEDWERILERIHLSGYKIAKKWL